MGELMGPGRGSTHALAAVLDGLMDRYKTHVPDVGAIVAAMVSHGLIARTADIENDHIAFRTLGVTPLGIASLEKERCVLDAFAHLPAGEIRREHRRDGFEAANADRIFESTYTAQATRRTR